MFPLKGVLHLLLFEVNYILSKVLPTGMIFLAHELFLYVYVTPPNICHVAEKIVVKSKISLLVSEGLFVFYYKNNITIRQLCKREK